MKKILFALALLTFYFSGVSQQNFQRSYGGNGNDRGHGLAATSDGGYAIAGQTNSFGDGGLDIFIIKVDNQGIIQWQKTYGSPLDELGYSINLIETPDSDLIVTGSGRGDGPSVLDFYLFKTNSNGDLLWANVYDSGPTGTSADHGRGLTYARNGDIIILGTDDSNTFGSDEGLIVRVDGDGNLIWNKVYGGGANEHLHGAIELPGGNLMAYGTAQSYGPGPRAGYLVKTDSSGNLIWAKTYGGNGIDYFHSGAMTSDFGLIVAGTTNSYGAGDYDVLLCKIDSSGGLQWTKTYGRLDEDWGVSLVSKPNDAGYLLTAYTESFDSQNRSILLINTDVDGELIWAKVFGTSGVESVDQWASTTTVITQDNGFATTCWSDSLSIGGDDVVLIKSDIDGGALCNSVEPVITSPNMEVLSINTNVSSVGSYSAISPTVKNSSMVGKEICYCMPDCEKCEMTLVHYDLNDCYSNTGNGSDMDYSEFVPIYPIALSYAEISGGILHRDNAIANKHSCTPGLMNTVAMCVSSLNSCAYNPNSDQAVVFQLTIVPDPDSSVQVSNLAFFEKAPTTFDWINGPSGPNNYPTLYGVRVLKNGVEIFREDDIPTTVNSWSSEIFDFSTDDDFLATDSTTFQFELLAYCLIGNAATVTAWDIDEVSVAVNCIPITGAANNIFGIIRNESGTSLRNTDVILSDDASFLTQLESTTTDHDGKFEFKHIRSEENLYIRGYNNTNFLNGVSTLDLIRIQRHLLGLEPLTSPYELLAADANKSNSVSVLDIYQIRSLILGRIQSFSNNTSWRFVNANQELFVSDPWNCSEVHILQNIGVDIGNAHFIGVKIGDVTNDAVMLLADEEITPRSESAVMLNVENQQVHKDQQVTIDFKSADLRDILGLQVRLNLNSLTFQSLINGKMSLSENNFHYSENGTLTISWDQSQLINFDNDDILFSLLVIPGQDGLLSEYLSIDRNQILPQVYLGLSLTAVDLGLNIENTGSKFQSVTLLQNIPNPFTCSTLVQFYLNSPEVATLHFYDISGQLLSSITRTFDVGLNEIEISKGDWHLPQGVVFCHLITPGSVNVHKMIVID